MARQIHALSARNGKPMVAVDAGAIPETLFESELFGHVKGAFTDAHTDHEGRFEQANGGTLFLDEVGNLPLHLQAKLLRAIQSRSIVRVGGTQPTPVDIRLICATNMNLEQLVAEGVSAKTFTTASTPSTLSCRHCATALPTSSHLLSGLWPTTL